MFEFEVMNASNAHLSAGKIWIVLYFIDQREFAVVIIHCKSINKQSGLNKHRQVFWCVSAKRRKFLYFLIRFVCGEQSRSGIMHGLIWNSRKMRAVRFSLNVRLLCDDDDDDTWCTIRFREFCCSTKRTIRLTWTERTVSWWYDSTELLRRTLVTGGLIVCFGVIFNADLGATSFDFDTGTLFGVVIFFDVPLFCTDFFGIAANALVALAAFGIGFDDDDDDDACNDDGSIPFGWCSFRLPLFAICSDILSLMLHNASISRLIVSFSAITAICRRRNSNRRLFIPVISSTNLRSSAEAIAGEKHFVRTILDDTLCTFAVNLY